MESRREQHCALLWRFSRSYMEKYGDIAMMNYDLMTRNSDIPSYKKPCHKFNSPEGCAKGKKCQFMHGDRPGRRNSKRTQYRCSTRIG